jgi:hypothetical protein
MEEIKQFTWDAAHSLVSALLDTQRPYREELKAIVAWSSELLAPLGEPLLLESPILKMLRREEAYSDWLAWCLEQIGTLDVVGRVLGVDFSVVSTSASGRIEVRREYYVPFGRPGSSGRLDLRLLMDGQVVGDVEVKLADADVAVTDKHEGYSKQANWPQVLIATAGSETSYGGFILRSWSDVCVALRHEARAFIQRVHDPGNLSRAAMILAFAASVEESLLGVPAALIRAICNRNEPSVLSGSRKEIHILQKWISAEERPMAEGTQRFIEEGVSFYRQSLQTLAHFEDLVQRAGYAAFSLRSEELAQINVVYNRDVAPQPAIYKGPPPLLGVRVGCPPP